MVSVSPLNTVMDRLIIPGAIGFTRLGYELRKPKWRPLAVSLAGKTAVVTGATSGLGRVTARRLADLGARVVIIGRDRKKTEQARRGISQATGNGQVVAELADLSLMSEVRSLAARLLETEQGIDILVNNAAVLPDRRTMTAEGFETTFATDLLSPFLLTNLLLPRLAESAPARVVNVLSGGMYLSGLGLEDLQNARGAFNGSAAYAKAKRALMVLTEHWAESQRELGVVANAMHPGWADTPGVQNSLPGFYRVMRPFLRTPEQGADTAVWLAAAPEAGEISGKFWLDREPHLTAVIPGTAGSGKDRARLWEELSRLAASTDPGVCQPARSRI